MESPRALRLSKDLGLVLDQTCSPQGVNHEPGAKPHPSRPLANQQALPVSDGELYLAMRASWRSVLSSQTPCPGPPRTRPPQSYLGAGAPEGVPGLNRSSRTF